MAGNTSMFAFGTLWRCGLIENLYGDVSDIVSRIYAYLREIYV